MSLVFIQALEKWEGGPTFSVWSTDDHSIGYFGTLRNLVCLLKMPVVAENLCMEKNMSGLWQA